MLILRLGLSDDLRSEIPLEQRSWHVAQEALARETGLEWQTRITNGRPTAKLSEAVEALIEEHAPDLVFVCSPAYWVSYPSVPLKMRDTRIPLGRRVARAGLWMSQRPRLADRALFHKARSMVTGSVGHSYFNEPQEALTNTEATLRMVVQREQIALCVRGPLPLTIPGPEHIRAEAEARRAYLNDRLAELCERLHIPFISYGPEDRHPPEELLGDRIHVNVAGHARRGVAEADLVIRAWRALGAASGDQ